MGVVRGHWRGLLAVVALGGAIGSMAVVAHGAGVPYSTSPPHLSTVPQCPIFPANNVWNEKVDTLPVASDSATMIQAIGLNSPVHPDFGSSASNGIPYNVATARTPKVPVTIQYASESFKGPYPIPAHPLIEAGSDHHLLIVNSTTCRLYELWDVHLGSNGHWTAGSGAIWNMRSNALRPAGWTSADAAGLPILPGLVRISEDVYGGAIDHALRFTAPATCAGYIYSARHEAGSGSCSVLPPMGLRLRLKASFDINRLAPQARPIARAMQLYGIILADNGSPWYIQGVPNPGWNDSQLHTLDLITGADLEVVDTSSLRNG